MSRKLKLNSYERTKVFSPIEDLNEHAKKLVRVTDEALEHRHCLYLSHDSRQQVLHALLRAIRELGTDDALIGRDALMKAWDES